MTAPLQTLRLSPVAGFLFDMDGTILTSIGPVERAWSAWATRIGADPAKVLDYMHGRRAIDTIRTFAPPNADIAAEVAWLDDREHADLDGVTEVEGAAAFLRALPPDRWAVVTSANRALALARIAAAGLPMPPLLVTSDDVTRGKPDPQGYLAAAKALGVDPAACVVFEDVPAGIAAGIAAGAKVIRIAGDHGSHSPHAFATIASYRQIALGGKGGTCTLDIAPPAA
jgi:mannitol-1-/sugar-/sorbitol-6-phosphatase